MISFQKVTKRYKLKTAIENISFQIEKGELVGLVGENGAGKTTILNILSGFKKATEGRVTINETDVQSLTPNQKRQIGYLPEQVPLYETMYVEEYLNFVFDLKAPSFHKKEHLKELSEKLKIDDVWNRLIRNLSKGYKQRIGLCSALIGYPELIVLDEPMSGLDPTQIKLVRSLLLSLKKDHTIIFSSHILSEVQSLCDRILFIENGKLKKDTNIAKKREEQGEQLELVVQGTKSEIQKKISPISGIKTIRFLSNRKNIYTILITQRPQSDPRSDLMRALQSDKAQLLEMSKKEENLEDLFFHKTEEEKE